ncbi:MAG: T9SS type A sorting domain-containing protein, partial [bacterium]
PAVSLSPINPHICAGQSITLTATGANTYVWSGPNGFGFGTTYTVNTTSQVSVTGSNQYGCMSLTQTTSVYVEPIPSFTILGPTSPMCEGSPLQLTATATPQSTYKWTGPNGYTSTVQNPLIPNATLANAGTYLVKATSQWGCENTGQVIVSIHPTPIVSVNGTSPICSGSPLNLVAAISNGSSVSWNGPNGFASTLLNPVIYNTTSANAGWYVATASNGYCSMKDSTYVQVNAGPTISIAPSQNNICSGEAVDLYASGAMSYHWSTGQTGPNITVSPTITTPYTVTGMNIAGCTSSYTITITINGNSLTSIFTSGIDASCNGEHDGAANVQVLNGVPPMTYDWTPDPVNGDGNNAAIGFAAGLVSVYYTDSRGCHGTNSILINEPAPITFAVPPIINGQNVSVTITGGTPPYQYGWSTGQTGNPVTFDPGIYVVSLTVNDGHYCQESFIINLASSGIDDVNTITFSIYPNPVSDILHIETGDVKIAEIQLLDITGKMILTAGKEKIINLTLFPAGFYLIQLTTKDGEILRSKVVKQ